MNLSATGAVVIPPIRFDGDKRISISTGQGLAHLIFFLTYFPKVGVVPFNQNFGPFTLLTSGETEQELVRSELVKLKYANRFEYEEITPSYIAQTCGLGGFRAFNAEEPGQWALAPSGRIATALDGAGNSALVIKLETLLPCPRPDVPIHEVLDFRNEHAESLDRLHHEIEYVATTLIDKADPEDALRIFAKRLEIFIRDVHDAFERHKVPRFWATLKPSLQIPGELFTALGGFAAAALGVPVQVGNIIAGAISIGLKLSRLPTGPEYPANFEYVLSGLRASILQSEPGLDKLLDYEVHRAIVTGNKLPGFYPPQPMKPMRFHGAASNNLVM